MTATFGLLSALNIGSLRAADVKWNPGLQPRAGAPKTETVANGMYQLSSQGYAIRGYILLGWSDRAKPVVRTQAAESSVQPLYRVGESIDIQADKTLYAVWASDANNDGVPDYKGKGGNLTMDPAFIDRKLAELERKRRSAESVGANSNLRAGAVSLPAWNINDDMLAYKEKVYYVGCLYNTDTVKAHRMSESIIAWNLNLKAFGRADKDSLWATRDLELVFEYGGVLEDSCLVGGRPSKPGGPQKRLTRIPFPKTVPGDTTFVSELFMMDPLHFTGIKADGDAVLKMYFVRKKTGKGPDTLAVADDFRGKPSSYGVWRSPGANDNLLYPKPFWNEETGEPSDTFTVRFKIYNRPEFASTTIRSRVHYGDTMRLNYGHLSGTPTKYMVRSLDGGWNWHPADSPLTDVERDLLQDDSVRVCLRELDIAVGYAADQKAGYLNPERFNVDNALDGSGVDGEVVTRFGTECGYYYFRELYERALSLGYDKDTIRVFYDGPVGALHDPWTTLSYNFDESGEGHDIPTAFGDVLYAISTGIATPTPHLTNLVRDLNYDDGQVDNIIRARMDRDFNRVFGQRIADAMPTPDWCHDGTYCFYVKRDPVPVPQRSVFIPTVEGVTVVSPGVGYTSIPSQKNFTFRVKYTGEPMTVTAKRLIDGRVVEVLAGTLNADGEYEYVIRRVMQDLTLEFTKTVANTLVDQPSVWANSGAVRIHAPKETTVRIYSASGVLVKQATVQGDKTVPLSAGLYLVVLSDGTTRKVLVQ